MADSIGDALAKRNLIRPDHLQEAQAEHAKSGEPIGRILLRKGYVREEDLARALAEQYKIPFIRFGKFLISKDVIGNGVIVSRTTYHPNGGVHTVSHYHDYQLHGPQLKYTASGKPLMELNWNHGILDGQKTIYRNGSKIATIPYNKGQKHGTEFHYDDLGNLTAEIEWRNDKKHGATKLYSEEATDTEWFFKGQSVNGEKFKTLDERESAAAQLQDREVR